MRNRRALCVLLGAQLVAGCSSGSSTTSTPDGAPGDAGARQDSRAREAASGVDAARRDASPDAARDAGHDVETAADAAHDVGARHDSGLDAEVTRDAASDGDAASHGCSYTGKARGTLDILATAATGNTIADFDIDCTTLFGIDGTGGIASCPASGCGAAPATVAAEGTYATGPSSIRIGTSGLFVLSPMSTPVDVPPKDAAPPPPIQLFALGRDGTGSHAVGTISFDGWGSSASPLLGTPGFLSFFVTRGVPVGGPGGPSTPLEVLQPEADGGAGSLLPFPGDTTGGSNGGPSTTSVSSSGKASYQTTLSLTGVSAITRYDLTATSTTGVLFHTAPASSNRPHTVVSSDAFVVWTESRTGSDAGPPVTYACLPTAPCTTPTPVTGLGAYTQLAATSDALFLTDAAGDLASCPASLVLAGTCNPSVLHTALSIGRFQADLDNVYILSSDGSHVMRIAR